jgi:hypothetical protein
MAAPPPFPSVAGGARTRKLASYVYTWGQFIDHDSGLTTTGDTAFNISVPKGDAGDSFEPVGLQSGDRNGHPDR